MAKRNFPKMPNSTIVMEFLLTRFSCRVLHAMLFLLMYLATLIGNLLFAMVITFDSNLHIPMYFFLRKKYMGYISVTIPKARVIFLLDNRSISRVGCASQIFFVLLFGCIELLFLTIMIHDHYVAICQPLHYSVTMNPWFCVQVTLASVLSGLAYSEIHTGNIFQLSFCQSNVVHHFFCDMPSLLKHSCSDILSNEILIFISVVLMGGGCFAFIIMSFSHIFSTVFKFPASGERGKAFSTGVPHILMVTVFISSGAVLYMKPTSNSPTSQDMISFMFYSIVPPFLKPIIYSLRKKQIKEAVKQIMRRILIEEKDRIII